MKRIVPILLIALLLCAFPFAVFAEGTLQFTPPTKRIYNVGEAPDYTGGLAIYNTSNITYRFTLSSKNCSGLDTYLPGNKTVTVSVAQDAPKAYFTITVLSNDEPILKAKDINETHWAYKAFAATTKAGYFSGDTEGNLLPNKAITRAEMAILLYRTYKNDPRVMTEVSDAAAPFSDVRPGDWFYTEIEACRKAGILKGDGNGKCNPSAKITRQDAILMLMRIQYSAADLESVDVQKAIRQSGLNPKDFYKTAGYAQKAMAMALGTLVKGDALGNINPTARIDRASVATILQRIFLGNYTWVPPVIEDPVEKPDPSKPNPNPGSGPLIFLSPSSQFANRYAAGNTTEGVQMNLLAQSVKKKLEAKGYRVYLPSSDTTYKERAALSNQVGADIHIPLHSNAGGGTGTRIFYNGAREGSYELSKEIFDRLGALTNTPLNKNNLKEDYLSLMPNGSPFHEISVPKAEMAYIEVEFHDNAEKALWIINNRDAIAQTIADGIIAYCQKYL